MRRETHYNVDFVLCESGDGWSLHAPGSTDEAIAHGDAPPLADGETGTPITQRAYRAAVDRLCPWAAVIVPVDGGHIAFESTDDARIWENQR